MNEIQQKECYRWIERGFDEADRLWGMAEVLEKRPGGAPDKAQAKLIRREGVALGLETVNATIALSRLNHAKEIEEVRKRNRTDDQWALGRTGKG